MKKSKLLALLSIPFMVSCGNGGPINKDRPIPDPVDPPKPVHNHEYNPVTGSCSCGLTYATEIKYNSMSYGEYMFKVTDKKVYFNFETECQTTFYVRTDTIGYKYIDKFNQCVTNIELYNANDLTTNIFENHNYRREDANTHTATPFSWYQSNDPIASESKFYCIITLADFIKEDEVPLFIELYDDHSINDENWVKSDDGSKRTNTFHCDRCNKNVVVEETYLLDISLPEIHITPGIDYSENIKSINDALNEYEPGLKIRMGVNYINSNYYGNTPVRDRYNLFMQIICYFGYAFDKDRTTIKYVDGTEAENLDYFSHDATIEFNISIPSSIE